MSTLSVPKNPNYCATIVKLDKLVPLENCNNVQAAIIFGNSVIVGKDTKINDVGIFFPIETQLSNVFLKSNNLYKHAEKNTDANKKGYFDDNGRIRAVKFRGHKSEGFYIPLSALDFLGKKTELFLGAEFDQIDDIDICQKYIVPRKTAGLNTPKQGKVVKRVSRLVKDQFRLHSDTSQLRKNMHRVNPDDFISITNKLHGSSFVVSQILTNRQLSWYEKIGKFLGFNIDSTVYDTIYSSRKVIKNEFIDTKPQHWYGYNLWGEIAETLKPALVNGVTLYGEVVGYTNNGGWIQNGYHYGAEPNKFKLYIYRITSTNTTGQVIEFSWLQIKQYCAKYNLNYVPEFYYGRAGNLYNIPRDDNWQNEFLARLEKDFNLNDAMCALNDFKVPAEGVVLRIEKLEECEVFKLKNWKFYERETALLDKGEVDMETEESEPLNNG